MSGLILPPGARGEVSPTDNSLVPSSSTVHRSDLGMPTIRTASSSKVRRYKRQAFWAQGGRIYIEDEQSGEFRSCSIRDFAERVERVGETIVLLQDSNERKLLVRMTGDARDVIMEALEQGDPHNPHVLAWKMRQRGRKTTIGGYRDYPTGVTKGQAFVPVGKPWPKIEV